MIVENNKTVKVHYHGYFQILRRFLIVHSKENHYLHSGRGQMIPGFEAEYSARNFQKKNIHIGT